MTQPWAIDLRASGITRSGSIAIVRPKPLQVSQAPTGWLKEKRAGRRVGVGDVAGRAVEGLAEAAGGRLALDPQLDAPLAVAQRRLERVHDPLALPVLDRDAVEHDL